MTVNPEPAENAEAENVEKVVPNRRERRNSGKHTRTADNFSAHGRSGAAVTQRQYSNRRSG
jgi:hypothetical protein